MTNLHNNYGIQGYDQYPVGQHVGQIYSNAKGRQYYNPLLAQEDTITVGGTATDGDYTIEIVDGSGTAFSATFTRAAAETNTAIATALVTALKAVAGLRNRATFTDNGDGTIDVAFKAADKVYTYNLTAPGPGTLAAANDQAAGGIRIPVGRFVIQSSANSKWAVPVTGSTAGADLVGVTGRDYALLKNSESETDEFEYYEKGSALTVIYRGTVSMRNVGPVAAVRGGTVHCVITSSGGNELGEARATSDGGNTISLSSLDAQWAEDVPAGEVGRIHLTVSPG